MDVAARYSDSHEDNTTTFCFFKIHVSCWFKMMEGISCDAFRFIFGHLPNHYLNIHTVLCHHYRNRKGQNPWDSFLLQTQWDSFMFGCICSNVWYHKQYLALWLWRTRQRFFALKLVFKHGPRLGSKSKTWLESNPKFFLFSCQS